jgi:hypothetical protein
MCISEPQYSDRGGIRAEDAFNTYCPQAEAPSLPVDPDAYCAYQEDTRGGGGFTHAYQQNA